MLKLTQLQHEDARCRPSGTSNSLVATIQKEAAAEHAVHKQNTLQQRSPMASRRTSCAQGHYRCRARTMCSTTRHHELHK
jgi:hypothetical protein